MKKAELTNQPPADAKPVLPAVRSFEYWTKKELEALPEGKIPSNEKLNFTSFFPLFWSIPSLSLAQA